jgi:hypothetical protein
MLIIQGWDDIFENNRTRGYKDLKWIPVPNKQDGDGYTELLEHKDGMAHLGAWLIMLQIASKSKPRGKLTRSDGSPHDSESLARMSRGKAKIFDEAIPRLVHIGWLTQTVDDEHHAPIAQLAAGSRQYEYAEQNRTEQKGIEENRTEENRTERKATAEKPSLAMVEMSAWYRRRKDTKWTADEMKAYHKIEFNEDDFALRRCHSVLSG